MAAVAKDPIADYFLSAYKAEEATVRLLSRAIAKLAHPAPMEERALYYLEALSPKPFDNHVSALSKVDGFSEKEAYALIRRPLRKPPALKESVATYLAYEKEVERYLLVEQPGCALLDKMRKERVCGLVRFEYDMLMAKAREHYESKRRPFIPLGSFEKQLEAMKAAEPKETSLNPRARSTPLA